MSEQLQNELNQHKQAVDGLLAQLDATKAMFNDTMNSNLQLRTNQIMLQKECQKLNTQLADKDKQIESLNQQLNDATAKLAEKEAQPQA